MDKDIKRIAFTKAQIEQRVAQLGAEISRDYEGRNPLLLCILRGGVVFAADLMRAIAIPAEIDFMALSSYGASTVSSGIVKIKKDVDVDLLDRHIIIVEDIIDSGLTLDYLQHYLLNHKPASVSICTFLNKEVARKVDLPIKYVGFSVENEFVVGYGLDFAEKYRNLPYIGILKEEIYS